MEVKYTKHFLNKLEDVFAESDYDLRYEKGNFKSGWCLLKTNKVVVVNKYFDIEGKINSLIDILRGVEINTDNLSEKNKSFYQEIKSGGSQVNLVI